MHSTRQIFELQQHNKHVHSYSSKTLEVQQEPSCCKSSWHSFSSRLCVMMEGVVCLFVPKQGATNVRLAAAACTPSCSRYHQSC